MINNISMTTYYRRSLGLFYSLCYGMSQVAKWQQAVAWQPSCCMAIKSLLFKGVCYECVAPNSPTFSLPIIVALDLPTCGKRQLSSDMGTLYGACQLYVMYPKVESWDAYTVWEDKVAIVLVDWQPRSFCINMATNFMI